MVWSSTSEKIVQARLNYSRDPSDAVVDLGMDGSAVPGAKWPSFRECVFCLMGEFMQVEVEDLFVVGNC